MNNKLIIISGPTASGKTKTSIDLALKIHKKFGREVVIINFDSLLFYKELSIGTAKPTELERLGVAHFMVDIASIKSPMNAADFIKICELTIKEQLSLDKYIILVGGSAFYLRALFKGMYESISTDQEIKDKFESLHEKSGIGPIIDYLKINDPESLINLHQNDHYRLLRAAMYFEMTNSKISAQKSTFNELSPYDFSQIIHPWEILHIYLDLPRDLHFEIIKTRTEKMFSDGLMNELEQLIQNGFSLNERPLDSVGYREAIDLKNGLFASQSECIERIAISTRQLAKSQRTFFRKIEPKLTFNPIDDQAEIYSSVEQFLG